MKRLVGLVLVAACGSVNTPAHLDAAGPDDAAVEDSSVDSPPPRCDPSKPFGKPAVVVELNSPSDDVQAFLMPDELEVWLTSTRPGGPGNSDIWRATRASTTEPFGAPSLVAGLNSIDIDAHPSLTADGLAIYIEHNANANSSVKIWRAARTSTSVGFGTPTEVTQLSSTATDYNPSILPDESAIYFASNRGGANADIYRSARMGGGAFGPPVLASGTNLNTTAAEENPTVTPDELNIYFSSSRIGSDRIDIWWASRPSTVQAFGEPVNVTEVNQATNDWPAWISADNCVLYFYRDIPEKYDLWVATRGM